MADRLRRCAPAGVTCSTGSASWDGQEPAEHFMARADLAMYEAKKAAGRAPLEEQPPAVAT